MKKTRQNKRPEPSSDSNQNLALGMRHIRCQFVLRYGHVAQAKLDGNVVEAAGSKPAIEMPQTGNDDSGNRGFNIRSRLVENQKVEARLSCDLDAGIDLFAGITERSEFRTRDDRICRTAVRQQERGVFQLEGRGVVGVRFFARSAIHQANRQELIELGQRAEQRDAAIEMRAGAKLDVLMPVLHPVQY